MRDFFVYEEFLCYDTYIMDWGTRRKATVIAIFLGMVILVIVYIIYIFFLKKPETCTDGLRNQDERGIDCGGVCSRMCDADVSPVIILWQRPIKISDGVYTALAYIENKNENAGAQKISYEMRMYDEKNILLTEPVAGETFLSPNGRSVIMENNINTGNRIPKTVFFHIKYPILWDRTITHADTSFITSSNVETRDIETYPKISARIKNNHTTYDYKNLPVNIIVYNAKGNVMTASNTVVDILPHLSEKNIYFSWQIPFSEKPARVEIIPRVNPFDI